MRLRRNVAAECVHPLNFAFFLKHYFWMRFNQLFNFTVVMTPRRTLIVCGLTAIFFIVAGALYDASALVDAPVKAWMGMR